MAESFITEEMRALIGVPGPKLTAPYPLGPDELRRFVQGVMEGNPVHWDEEAAAASRYGEVVATPLYPMHSTTRRAPGTPDPLDRVHDDPGWDGTDLAAGLGGLPPIDVPLKRILNGGTEAEFFAMDDACPPCRALAGKVFDPREAPVIPVRDCRNEACRCDYLPAL